MHYADNRFFDSWAKRPYILFAKCITLALPYIFSCDSGTKEIAWLFRLFTFQPRDSIGDA